MDWSAAVRSSTVYRVKTANQLAGIRAGAERQRGAAVHPFQRWLYERTEGPQTQLDIAACLCVNVEQVRSWLRQVASRRVPRRYADDIQVRWGYQATAENWPNGIREAR